MSVLKTLKRAGIYEVNHFLPTRGGFHEFDLKAFVKNLLDSTRDCESTSVQGVGTVTLRSVLCGNRNSSEIKLNVVRAVLSRNIAVLRTPMEQSVGW